MTKGDVMGARFRVMIKEEVNADKEIKGLDTRGKGVGGEDSIFRVN